MFETIIWATDGSDTADRALPYAKALADGPGHRLIAVHCKETYSGRGGGWPVLADEDEIQDKIRRQVAEADDESLDVSLRIITAAAPGAPHKIADLARELDADAIVVGTRGHSPAAGVLLGSLTQRLLHIAPCPVVAVPPSDRVEGERAHPATATATH
jgi:nucleotide-binding universal stress UspA family protein